MSFNISVDGPDGQMVTFPGMPCPEAYEIDCTIQWLNREAKIGIVRASISAGPSGRSYWRMYLMGPDGEHVLDSKLFDGVTLNGDATVSYCAEHRFSEEDVLAAAHKLFAVHTS